jgi:hypothetical protein
MRSRVFLGFLALLTLLGAASPSLAQGRFAHAPYYSGVQPLSSVLPSIRSGYPGRFYDAEGPFPDASGGLHYHIKWMTPEGRIIWLDTDARTGRVIGRVPGGWAGMSPPPPPYGYPRAGNFGYRPPIMVRPGGPNRGWGPHGGYRH